MTRYADIIERLEAATGPAGLIWAKSRTDGKRYSAWLEIPGRRAIKASSVAPAIAILIALFRTLQAQEEDR